MFQIDKPSLSGCEPGVSGSYAKPKRKIKSFLTAYEEEDDGQPGLKDHSNLHSVDLEAQKEEFRNLLRNLQESKDSVHASRSKKRLKRGSRQSSPARSTASSTTTCRSKQYIRRIGSECDSSAVQNSSSDDEDDASFFQRMRHGDDDPPPQDDIESITNFSTQSSTERQRSVLATAKRPFSSAARQKPAATNSGKKRMQLDFMHIGSR